MKKIIRRGTPEDAMRFAIIHVETWQASYRGLMPNEFLEQLSVSDRYNKWKEILRNESDPTIYLVGEVGGKVMGWASLCACRDEDAKNHWGELGGIYVHPTAQNKRLGTMLMSEGLNLLKKASYTQATLWVLTSNTAARDFYESKGWREDGKIKIDTSKGFELHETRYIVDL